MLQIAICDDEKFMRDALFSMSRDLLAQAGRMRISCFLRMGSRSAGPAKRERPLT